jgi:hypothetical protein
MLALRHFNTEAWRAVAEHCEGEIVRLRQLNDNDGNSELDTAILRGQIKFAKSLLGLDKSNEDLPTR